MFTLTTYALMVRLDCCSKGNFKSHFYYIKNREYIFSGPETRRVHRQLTRHVGQRQLRRRLQWAPDEDGDEGGGQADQDREGRGWKHSDAGDQTVRPSAETHQLDQSARLPLQRPHLLDGDGVLRGGRPERLRHQEEPRSCRQTATVVRVRMRTCAHAQV